MRVSTNFRSHSADKILAPTCLTALKELDAARSAAFMTRLSDPNVAEALRREPGGGRLTTYGVRVNPSSC